MNKFEANDEHRECPLDVSLSSLSSVSFIHTIIPKLPHIVEKMSAMFEARRVSMNEVMHLSRRLTGTFCCSDDNPCTGPRTHFKKSIDRIDSNTEIEDELFQSSQLDPDSSQRSVTSSQSSVTVVDDDDEVIMKDAAPIFSPNREVPG